jgi:hypothetical protein
VIADEALGCHVSTTEWGRGACAPVPDKPTTTEESEALLTSVRFPLDAPALAGVNVTVIDVDCPGFSITPLDTPVALNPAPPTLTLENVTTDLPVLETVIACVAADPTLTLPKL